MKEQRKGEFLSTRVQYIPVGQIRPNPRQPRRSFSEEGLRELADSIRAYGILQPLTVRRVDQGYELVAGERRLRAARMADLREVPCLIARVGEEDSALLALIENLQRRDLDYWEEAEAIARLIRQYGLSQEEAAEKIGKSQSGVANKLRLLRLPEGVRRLIRESGLTERHARALLRLPDEENQRRAVAAIVKNGWNVARTETYVEDRLKALRTTPPRRRTTYIIKDVRLFLNSVDRGVRMMRQAGVGAEWGREDADGCILLTIRIPTAGKGA
ncbi:MAG: ParB/RepB/Spo0J family partition protein [Ruminococcaceae bacterium]|nr:ParB/RepB/Spo0J family partition protein [Oscillospiraceae bacterium]